MFKIKSLDHVVIRVKDLPAVNAFYVNVLGCSEDKRRDDLGLVHLRVGQSLIDLISVDGPLGRAGGPPPGAGGRNMDHLRLQIEPFDLNELRAHFQDAGLDTGNVQMNYGAGGDGPSIYVSDPEGNTIELKGG